MALSIKQDRFVKFYCKGDTMGNATQSYIKAGYKDSDSASYNACRLISTDKIQAAIQAHRATQEQKTDVTREYITAKLQDQYDKADTAKDRTNALRAIDLLGKTIGVYIDTSRDISEQAADPLTEQELEQLREQAKTLTNRQQIKVNTG